MKIKTTIIIALFLLITNIAFSQAPNSFKYQSMIRKIDGSALANQTVNVKISILKGNTSGESVYSESNSVSSNAFGVVSFNIGEGSNQSGSISNIDWSSDSYFVKIEMDETGGNNYALSSISQLLSVPYALNANSVNSIDWSKVQNKPTLFSSSYNDLTDKPTLFSGSYNDLSNTPIIPAVQVQTDWNATSGMGVLLNKPTLFSGSYNDLTEKPNLSDTSKYLKSEIDPIFNASIAKGINSNDTAKWNAKSNFSGNYNDLVNKPNNFATKEYVDSIISISKFSPIVDFEYSIAYYDDSSTVLITAAPACNNVSNDAVYTWTCKNRLPNVDSSNQSPNSAGWYLGKQVNTDINGLNTYIYIILDVYIPVLDKHYSSSKNFGINLKPY
jgi:hypothetical protein